MTCVHKTVFRLDLVNYLFDAGLDHESASMHLVRIAEEAVRGMDVNVSAHLSIEKTPCQNKPHMLRHELCLHFSHTGSNCAEVQLELQRLVDTVRTATTLRGM